MDDVVPQRKLEAAEFFKHFLIVHNVVASCILSVNNSIPLPNMDSWTLMVKVKRLNVQDEL